MEKVRLVTVIKHLRFLSVLFKHELDSLVDDGFVIIVSFLFYFLCKKLAWYLCIVKGNLVR